MSNIPVALDDNYDDEKERLKAEVAALRRALEEIREVWAGSECGEPVHAQEAYAINLCRQQYRLACDALDASKK